MHNPPWTQRKFAKSPDVIHQKTQSRTHSPTSFLQASLVVAVLVLLYCLYVVQDWLDMLTHDQVVHHKCSWLPLAIFSAIQQHHFPFSLAVQNFERYNKQSRFLSLHPLHISSDTGCKEEVGSHGPIRNRRQGRRRAFSYCDAITSVHPGTTRTLS